MFSYISFLIWTIILVKVRGEAEVLVSFTEYKNQDGTLSNGHCCDGWPLRCERDGGCDYYFRVCMDEVDGVDTTKSCKYGYHRSNKVADNMKNVVFGRLANDEFGGVKNPMSFRIPEPVDGRFIRLKVDVKDEDRWTKGDYVDYFSEPIKLYKGIYPEIHTPVELVSRTRLLTAVTIKCAPGFYGEFCTTVCEAPGPNDHYKCDLWEGQKICVPGWTGDNCERQVRNSRRRNRRP